MSHRGAWFIVAVLMLAVVQPLIAAGKGEPKHVVILLRHAAGHAVARSLAGAPGSGQAKPAPLKVEGLDYLAVDESRNAVLAVGSDAAIGTLRRIVALLDVPSRAVTVRLTIVRSTRRADGSLATEVVGKPVVKTLNNEEATISVGDDHRRYAATILPRLNGDETILITAELRIERGSSAGAFHRSTRRLPQGKTSFIAWVPDVFDKAAANADMLGAQPVTPQEQPGLFLEVSATADAPSK